MYWVLVALGFAIVAIEIMAARRNRATHLHRTAPRLWLSIYEGRWFWGLSTALVSLFIIYPLPFNDSPGETLRVVGFPFMVGVLGEYGRDFVSSPEIVVLTLSANAVVWYFVPSLILWAWTVYCRRGSHESNA